MSQFNVESPFDLANDSVYQNWRERKLASYPSRPEELMVEIKNPFALSSTELREILRRCQTTNTVLYACRSADVADKAVPKALGEQLGLVQMDGNLCADEDSISSIQVRSGGARHEGYIPYTDRPINWHTDGYYNAPSAQIRAMLLHCASDAASGGDNALLDHEIAYILMRDENPEYIAAMMQPDAMTIPPNLENGVEIRGAQAGPVFSIEQGTGNLHMRYTARKRNVEWRPDPVTQAAVRFLGALLENCGFILRYRLGPGEGIISNNALHNRTGFSDDPENGRVRLIYRARYYDRIRGTDLADIY
jgi:hypothetical protein